MSLLNQTYWSNCHHMPVVLTGIARRRSHSHPLFPEPEGGQPSWVVGPKRRASYVLQIVQYCMNQFLAKIQNQELPIGHERSIAMQRYSWLELAVLCTMIMLSFWQIIEMILRSEDPGCSYRRDSTWKSCFLFILILSDKVVVIDLLNRWLLSHIWVSIRPAGLLGPKTWPMDLGAQPDLISVYKQWMPPESR